MTGIDSRRSRSRETARIFFCCGFGEAAAEVGFEFLDEQRQAFFAAAAMADGVLDGFLEDCAVVEFDVECVGDGALVGIVVVARELRLFDAVDGGAQGIDARSPDRVQCDLVFVIGGGEAAED